MGVTTSRMPLSWWASCEKDDVYTSVHLEEFESKRDTKRAWKSTWIAKHWYEEALKDLDEMVLSVSVLKLKKATFLLVKGNTKGEKTTLLKNVAAYLLVMRSRDTWPSLRVPHGGDGVVRDVEILHVQTVMNCKSGVNMLVRVYIAQNVDQVGDKMAGRLR